MSANISLGERRYAAALGFILLAVAAVVFTSGLLMVFWHHTPLAAAAHALHPVHLIFGLIFIGVGLLHVRLNCWKYRQIFSGGAGVKFSSFFLPVLLIAFLFMAVTGLGIWLFHWHDIVAAHILLGYVMLGLVAIHGFVRMVWKIGK